MVIPCTVGPGSFIDMESIFTEYISPFFLAILQGITEFLPVSSSGHLVLLNSVMPVDAGLLFDLVLHFATLISVVAFYRHDIAQICVGCVHEIKTPGDRKNLKFVAYLLAATFITGVIGLCLNDWVETRFRSPIIVGILLILNAGILWTSRKKGLWKMTDGALTLKTSLLIGLAQGLAVLPGISRSGTTITTALLLGIQSKDCAKISFLLSIPVICGALILHIKDISGLATSHLPIIILAAIVAAVVGYISLVILEKLLKKANFHIFAPYCLILGIIAVVCGILFR